MLIIGILGRARDTKATAADKVNDEEDVMVVGLQGMSQRPFVTPLSLLLRSNYQVRVPRIARMCLVRHQLLTCA